MAYVRLTNGMDGNLDQARYNFGADDDTVRVNDAHRYVIQTLGGDDQIWLTGVTSENAENMIFCGSGNDLLVGSNIASEIVFDGSGNDVILTSGGNDEVNVGSGDDYYSGGAGIDTLSFWWKSMDLGGWGLPNTVGVFLNLSNTQAQYLGAPYGTDTIVGFEKVIGTLGHDSIQGNAERNVFESHSGNDQLFGRGGADRLDAGAGTDFIVGGLGADQLVLGEDNTRDTVVYESVSDSGTTDSNRDGIYQFDRNGLDLDDIINLRAIDGNAALAGDQTLIWRSNAAAFGTDARGEVRFQDLGADVLVWVDTDADVAAEMSFLVSRVGTMDAADFLL